MFSLDILLVFVSARRRYCRTGWTKKLSSKILFTSSPNIDGFCRFLAVKPSKLTIHYKDSTECAGAKMLTIGRHLSKIWTRVCGLPFGSPCRPMCSNFNKLGRATTGYFQSET